MDTLFYAAPGVLEWRETTAPRIEAPHDALVRPIVATTCDIDPLIIAGRTPMKGPFPIGHEAIGEVVAVGEAVERLRPGDRVVMNYYDACGHCARCAARRPNRCLQYSPDLMRRTWHGVGLTSAGFFTDIVRVASAESMLTVLPPNLDATHLASLGDNIGFAWEFTAPFLAERPGSEVLIMGGCGSIALYAVAFAMAAKASRVTYVDTAADRLEIAERYGARVIDGPTPTFVGSFPLVIDASANADSLLCAIRSTEVEGRCMSVGGHFAPVSLPLLEMYAKGIDFYTGPGAGAPNIEGALAMILDGSVDPSPVTSSVNGFADAAKVLATPSRKPVFLR